MSCNTDLTQQEELVSTFLCVFITGALHLLQVDPIQLELLLSSKSGSTSEFYFHISFISSLFKPCTCLWERETEWVDAHRLYTKNIKNVTTSKKDKEDIYRNTELGSVIITSLKYSGVFSVSATRASHAGSHGWWLFCISLHVLWWEIRLLFFFLLIGMKHKNSDRYFKDRELISFIRPRRGKWYNEGRDSSIVEF